jgi:uracil-DNA glycosylase family 4
MGLSRVKAPTVLQRSVFDQRPAPPGRMTTVDAKALGCLCDICPLSKGKRAPLMVPPTLIDRPKFVIVGEGPGRVEEAHGKVFIGPTGQFLNRLLQESNIDRNVGSITNVMLCRGDTDKENLRAAECCTPRLLRELAAIPPAIPILTLGKPATKAVLGTAKIFFARGFIWKAPPIDEATIRSARKKTEKNANPDLARRVTVLEGRSALADRIVIPTVHPAFVLRADTWKPVLQVDIRRFGRLLKGELRDDNLANVGKHTILRTPDRIRRALSRMGLHVAVDIETDGVNPVLLKILCVGISDGKRTVVIHPWDAKQHAEVLSEALATRTAVFHNGINFDMLALRREGVVISDDRWQDTILAHHVIGSHFPQRLDHCVSVYLDSGLGNWKMKFGRKGAEEKGVAPKHMDPATLCAYNAQDVILDIKLWFALQDDLKSHMAVYLHDKELAKIAGKMIVEGIGVDVPHRTALRNNMKKRQDALKGLARRLVKRPTFNPSLDVHIRKALFRRFRAPVLFTTPTGLPSTASGTLEVYRGNGTKAGRFADIILNWRAVRKSRTTYIDAPMLDVQHTSIGPRIMVPWKVYGTPTGRWSSRLQSIPRPEKDLSGKLLLESRVREMYVPRRGCVFVYFDISQAEARIAANISGDPNFIETCRGDVHTGNACAIFPDHADIIRNETKGRGKPFRDVAKNFMFGIVYGAAADTIYKFLLGKGFKITLREVQKLLELLHKKYRVYFRYCERNVAFCSKYGYQISPFLFRRRFMGFHPKPEEVKNFPAQSGVADVMNIRLIDIMRRLPSTDVRLVGQFHDAAAFECPIGKDADDMEALIRRTWADPVTIPKSIMCDEPRTFMLPIDLKRGDRLSAL